MAALQKIRGWSWLVIIILGVALLAFILNDFFSSGSRFFNRYKDIAFSVNGEMVHQQKYFERVEEFQNFEKMISGGNLDDNTTAQIRELTYQQMVKEMTLDDQAEALGLTVTKEELNDMVYGDNISPILYGLPLFKNPKTGQFDKNILSRFLIAINQNPTQLKPQDRAQLMQMKSIWAFIEHQLKYSRLEEKYSSLVAGTIFVNNIEVKSAAQDAKVRSDIAYVAQNYATISDSAINVSDAEIKALYEKRKANYRMQTPLSRISYFVKNIVPSDQDFAAVEKVMKVAHDKLVSSKNPASVVSEFSSIPYVDAFVSSPGLPIEASKFVKMAKVGDIYGPEREGKYYIMYKLLDKTIAPDSVKLRMIALPPNTAQKNVDRYSDSIMTVIKRGKDFAKLAEQMMPGSNGGDIGWCTELMLANTGIASQCFSAKVGTVMKVTINGQRRIVKVEAKTKPVSKYKLALVQMPIIISDKTQNRVDNELSQFISQSGNSQNFDKGAQIKGYSVISDILISPSDFLLGQNKGTRNVIHWAFNAKLGEVKKFDYQDKRIIAILKNKLNEKYMPLSEVKISLKNEIIRNKKAEIMIHNLKSKNLQTLAQYAKLMSSRIDTIKFVTFATDNLQGFSSEPIFNVAAKLDLPNQVSKPKRGNSAIFVTSVIRKSDDAKSFDIKSYQQRIKQANVYMFANQAVLALKDKMEVKDNRAKFF